MIEHTHQHFACFSAVDNHLYELDGRKKFPINHGSISDGGLLRDASQVMQGFMDRDPGEIRFTMVALVEKQGN